MEYAVRGVSFGREVELTWRDGTISGPAGTVELLGVKAKAFRRMSVGRNPHTAQPLSLGPDHLANPHGAYVLMRALIFQGVLEESGEIPELPEPSPGARS